MSGPDTARVRLSRLLSEVETERTALERIAREVDRYAPGLGAADRPVLALMAVDLHDYYTALEALFERIARAVDGEMPSDADWHRELVDQMAAEVPPLRPAVISAELRVWLHGLRAFRHFFRHSYAVELEASHLARHADALRRRHPSLVGSVDTFLDFVRRTRDALPAA